MFPIIKFRKIWYSLSAIMVLASIVIWIVWGMNLGIDFTGGTLLQVKYTENNPSVTEIKEKIPEAQVQPSDDTFILKLSFLDQEGKSEVLNRLEQLGPVEEESYEAIGPTLGQELKSKAVWAILFVVLGIIAFVSYAFRKVSSGPVPSWVYGLGAIVALVHDILITIGVFIVLGHFLQVEVNIMFITALLTVLGYSVNDTIIVYDRVRENLKTSSADNFEGVIEESVNQTITRSLNTSVTTLLVLFALFLFGGESIKYFVLALICGISIGTYSSIFLASPLLLVFQKIVKR